ncbi:inositol monophosphatase family protein [Roseobacter sp. CCS2]|uniref:inositol monophosphatase family protein n=1 Tax=Roseobacter sp. CCS2 TaxID=391593 RepID=UPI0000F3F129|nr:3'(2'),5'-bisphosphate nucleotidase CysQ [Roseobacter sp. CCS2]EBA11255.1 inositol monophosphatase family protein [Roseobacter sp. CCS2]
MPETDLALLIAAARRSGDIAKQYFQQNPDVTDKPDGAGPVTAGDLAVNAMLEGFLQAARPDYGWLSEETEDNPARLDTTHQFIIDPIDGTRAFIEGSKDWAHSLAIAQNGAPVAAAVYLPMRDLMFAAAKGAGATLNGKPIVATTAPMDGATLLGTKPNFDGKFWKDGVLPPVKRAFRSSLAYRLCLVAQGRFDGMITLRPSWEWDIAAGALIVEEANAAITDQDGAALNFNNRHPQVPGVLAAGSGLHRDLLARLEPQQLNP